jgi:hypothetical protein
MDEIVDSIIKTMPHIKKSIDNYYTLFENEYPEEIKK